ncbi:Manba-prov protein [Meloidogyne graminicola]|uniref:beta-mannosidase n=1 Tax=Meloidogyne graminicola TaxID=189291 RepID=A0A8T0A4Y3_9BILA|nr:Manba-prov protein [Meloidogyne graminicola]
MQNSSLEQGTLVFDLEPPKGGTLAQLITYIQNHSSHPVVHISTGSLSIYHRSIPQLSNEEYCKKAFSDVVRERELASKRLAEASYFSVNKYGNSCKHFANRPERIGNGLKFLALCENCRTYTGKVMGTLSEQFVEKKNYFQFFALYFLYPFIRMFLLFYCPFLLINLVISLPSKIDFGGNLWNFYSPKLNISGSAVVPGDIYSDLEANNFIKNPLFGQGDKLYKWIGQQDWTYERNLLLPEESNNVLLKINGLNGLASIWFNDYHIANIDNQFQSSLLNLTSLLAKGMNFIRISFKSPVKEAEINSNVYKLINKHILPPECPPPSYNGECHVNFLRSMQASFAWDWGPSVPFVGIWKPIELIYFNKIFIEEFSPLVEPFGTTHFFIKNSISFLCSFNSQILKIELIVDELGLKKNLKFRPSDYGNCPQIKLEEIVNILIPSNKIKLWWPNGYGSQPLYNLTLKIYSNEELLDFSQKRIAFRTIYLNQSFVNKSDHEKGRLFQFEINNLSIFLKGTNWIPISVFPSRNNSLRRDFLFHSIIKANMNVLRVWGGGFYESDEFYDLADELGLLIWQDFMFACALYPTNKYFLNSVEKEVEEQVLRLRHHPSLLCWAGNNENELVIRNSWYPTKNYSEELQSKDYLILYKQTIQPIVEKLDKSRPFLLSSPSNGIKTEMEGGISKNPNNPLYGDIHFYIETKNLWKDSTYLIPRCATEFGVQSMPFKGTMINWIKEKDWRYTSKTLLERQHHPGGALTLLTMTFQHFSNLPFNSLPSFIDKFSFLSQVHQAIALQTQIEHYRRWRSTINSTNGQGYTMCAMYWQLNDVWAAPTWSTIDFDLRWKIGHYFVKRSFAPLILSMLFFDQFLYEFSKFEYLDDNENLHLFVCSDLLYDLYNSTIHIKLFLLKNENIPIYQYSIKLNKIPLQTSFEIFLPEQIKIKIKNKLKEEEKEEYLLSSTFNSTYLNLFVPQSLLFPNKFNSIGKYGNAKISKFKRITNFKYLLKIKKEEEEKNNILPLIWIDFKDYYLKLNFNLIYYFNDNGFALIEEEEKEIYLIIFNNPKNIKIVKEDFKLISE